MPSLTPIVFIPGLFCNQALWNAQVTALSPFADIVFADVTKQDTIAATAAAAFKQAPARFSLAGFSLGSQVALEIMSTCPDRVEPLALLSASHGGVLPAVADSIRHAIETIERGGFHSYLEAIYPTYVSAAHAVDPAMKRCFIEMAQAVG